MTYWWFWLAVLVIAIIVEVCTDQLISIWFVPGAIASIVVDLCSGRLIWQVLVFFVVSIVGIVVGKKFLSKYRISENHKTNIDAIIGEKCIVTEKVNTFAGCGQAKVHGQVWSCRGVSDDDVFEEGEILKIVAIEGVKLIVKKL